MTELDYSDASERKCQQRLMEDSMPIKEVKVVAKLENTMRASRSSKKT